MVIKGIESVLILILIGIVPWRGLWSWRQRRREVIFAQRKEERQRRGFIKWVRAKVRGMKVDISKEDVYYFRKKYGKEFKLLKKK